VPEQVLNRPLNLLVSDVSGEYFRLSLIVI